MPRVAFLGLGAIGTPMARHLATPDHDLVVWNRTAAKADAFVQALAAERTARVAHTPADAAAGRDVVITCLPVSRDVESLLDGPTGLLATMARGSVLVDCTSGDSATSRRMAARLAEHGIAFIDAPVSGGVVGAENAALTVMVGGDEAVLERVRPVLAHFGTRSAGNSSSCGGPWASGGGGRGWSSPMLRNISSAVLRLVTTATTRR